MLLCGGGGARNVALVRSLTPAISATTVSIMKLKFAPHLLLPIIPASLFLYPHVSTLTPPPQVNASSLFWGLWRVVSPLLDPVTRSKVVFLSHDQKFMLVEELGPEVGAFVRSGVWWEHVCAWVHMRGSMRVLGCKCKTVCAHPTDTDRQTAAFVWCNSHLLCAELWCCPAVC